MRRWLPALLLLACGTAAAAPPEELAAIAERHRPGPRAELLRADDLSGWIAGAVLAFYVQPVLYETPSPQDRDVAGWLLLPQAGGAYRRVWVDTYGPEGANAEVVGVAVKSLAGRRERVLSVRVIWQNTHGRLEQTCHYLPPAPGAPPPRLVRLKHKACAYAE